MRGLSERESQIVGLLLTGADNQEIACQLHMARRTVKAHFNRMFMRYGIRDGIKRVKLATLLYAETLDREGVESHRLESESGELLKEWQQA